MTTTCAKIEDIISEKVKCPLPINVIPNQMGINLCSVEAISWTRQDDGQLTVLVIHFIPATEEEKNAQGPGRGIKMEAKP